MTDEINELKDKIALLEKELEEAKQNNEDSTFDELKQKYESIIEEKNKEINELNKTVETTRKKVDSTVQNLNDEVTAKLQQSEELAELQRNVDELLHEKAEVTVDTYIQKGIIPKAKRDIAVKLCLNDNDTFLELYRDAQPIIELKPKSKKVNTDIGRLVDYFKN